MELLAEAVREGRLAEAVRMVADFAASPAEFEEAFAGAAVILEPFFFGLEGRLRDELAPLPGGTPEAVDAAAAAWVRELKQLLALVDARVEVDHRSPEERVVEASHGRPDDLGIRLMREYAVAPPGVQALWRRRASNERDRQEPWTRAERRLWARYQRELARRHGGLVETDS